MSQSRITGAVLLRWEDCTSILSKHLTTLLQRPIQLCRMVEDYDYFLMFPASCAASFYCAYCYENTLVWSWYAVYGTCSDVL